MILHILLIIVHKEDIDIMVSSVMLAAGCFLYRSWEALLIGTVGAIIACISMPLMDKMRIDDPVGASSVHGNDISVPIDALNCQ